MGGASNQRPILTLNDWMRQIEKRLLHEERRPSIRNAADLLGPGIAPNTVQTWDWNGPEHSLNGLYYSVGGSSLHSPDDTTTWFGVTQATGDGSGYQLVHQFDPTTGTTKNTPMIRFFYTPMPGAQPVYTTWSAFGGSATGGAPTGPAGGDLAGTYPNPTLNPTTKSAMMVDVQDEGTQVRVDPAYLNFIGAGVTASDDGSGGALINIPGGGGGAGTPSTVQVFTANGTYTPPAGALTVVVECLGGGGGGAGAGNPTTGNVSIGSGGGGGGYTKRTYAATAITGPVTVTVGSGGNGANGNNNGNAGGDSTFLGMTGGGGGGGVNMASVSNSQNAGGAGGTATGGQINIPGEQGETIRVQSNTDTPPVASPNWGGAGAVYGTASRSTGGSAQGGAGFNGTNRGSGGSGAMGRNSTGGPYAGGNGSDGIVIVTTHFGNVGPQGPPGPTYTPYKQDFGFASALTTWTLTHNQGRKSLSVYAVDTNGDELVAEVLYPDNNTITLTHYYAQTGTATVYG